MEKHRKAVLDYLYRTGGAIRTEIMDALHMRQNNIVKVCDELLSSGDIRQEDNARKRNVRLKLADERFCAVGIEHMPDRLLMVMLDASRKEIERREIAIAEDCSGAKRLAFIVKTASAFCRSRTAERVRVTAAGMADVAIIDYKTGRSIYAAHVRDWNKMPIKESLEKCLGCHVDVINRADAACYADMFKTGNIGNTELIYVIVKGGIGASIVLGGNFLRERLSDAGEMGHIIVDEKGALCSCGRHGCLETVAAAEGLSQKIMEAEKKKSLSIKDILSRAEKGDKFCTQILRKGGEHLGKVTADMAGFVGIGRIVLRSEINDAKKIYISAFAKALRENMHFPLSQTLDLSSSGVDDLDASLGVALFALNKSFE
jgi:predicted NBD/HSP70 family sugar kinase